MPCSGGINVTRYIGRVFDIKLDLNYTRLHFPTDAGMFDSIRQRFKAQTYSAGLGFKIKAPINDNFFLHPYLLVQPRFSWVAADRYSSSTAANDFTRYGTFTGQVGAGIDFHLGELAILLRAGWSDLHASQRRSPRQ